jgi:toxin FitB
MLLDSNIIIYSCQTDNQMFHRYINHQQACCSAVSQIEALGYHKLTENEKYYLCRFFDTVTVYPVIHKIIQLAIKLRQQRKMSLGDAIIAATALEYRQTLVTRNSKDFDWIDGLHIINPFDSTNLP